MLHGWQANIRRTCALPVSFRAMPENEIPPATRVDFYLILSFVPVVIYVYDVVVLVEIVDKLFHLFNVLGVFKRYVR